MFNKFKGKSLDTKGVDFSDRISRRTRTGYDARSGDWELVAEGEKETPIQKYQRLQCEMKELLEEVSEIKEKDKNEEKITLNYEQVDQALKQLQDLRLEDSLGLNLTGNLADPQGNQIKKLLSQLEQFKQTQTSKPDSTDSITYKLTYNPSQVKLDQTTRLSSLEHRLHKLESILGGTSDKLMRLSGNKEGVPLFEVAQTLNAKSNMLDSAQLDHIEGRLTALQQKMNTIKESEKEKDAEKDQMVSKTRMAALAPFPLWWWNNELYPIEE